MNRRVIAAVLAAVLVVLGGGLLYSYVRNADARAMQGMETTSVLVVTSPITKGAPAEAIGRAVQLKQLPKAAVVASAATDLSQLSGKVAGTDLVPGEQVLTTRFVDPVTQSASTFDVPKGMQEVSVVLPADRVLGGTVKAGALVGVAVSLKIDNQMLTHIVLNQVLVTRVQGGVPGSSTTTANPAPSAQASAAEAPKVNVIVTLALAGPDAEKVIFGAEHGTVYLTVQTSDTNTTGTRVVTTGNIYQ
jgi:pilus assembly protein CpaB